MLNLAICVFFVMFLLDYADTRHKLAIETRAPKAAAFWSVVMYLLGLFSTWAALDVATWLIIPACAGLATGSIVAVYRARGNNHGLG